MTAFADLDKLTSTRFGRSRRYKAVVESTSPVINEMIRRGCAPRFTSAVIKLLFPEIMLS